MRRSVGQFLQGSAYRRALETVLPSNALVHLEKAFEGDVEAALRLISAAPNRFRAHILVAAYCLDTPNPAYQTVVREVWDGDHDQVVRLTRNKRPWIKRMMAAADFDVSSFPPLFCIWRGTTKSRFVDAAKGLSWTRDRNVACLFAFRNSGKPLVLRASVKRDDVVYFSNSRNESEVVPRAVINAHIDGAEPDWRVAKDMLAAKIRKEVLSR